MPKGELRVSEGDKCGRGNQGGAEGAKMKFKHYRMTEYRGKELAKLRRLFNKTASLLGELDINAGEALMFYPWIREHKLVELLADLRPLIPADCPMFKDAK